MTIDELVDWAQRLIKGNEIGFVEPDTIRICHAIIDLLGEAQPCHIEAPETGLLSDDSTFVVIPLAWAD
jgi:hypothetical protein